MTKKRIGILCCAAVLLVFVTAAVFLAVRHQYSVKKPTSVLPEEKKVIEFGAYPQSRVTDETLISKLNGLPAQWKSYGYYNGNGSFGSAQQSDFMQYTDVKHAGKTYRGVRFSEYRSYCCHNVSSISWQRLYYGLACDTVYWYKFEPVRWIVLSEDDGFLLSESVLDSQPFNSIVFVKNADADTVFQDCYKDAPFTVYATDYYTSDLRAWLNGDFFETAFSPAEAEKIEITELNNSAWNKRYSQFDSRNSQDKVFLLSYREATDPRYGFSALAEKPDDLRTCYPTDYARCQGVWIVGGPYKTGACWWWLRTGGIRSAFTCACNVKGAVAFSLKNTYSPDCVDTGVRPAIRLKKF